MYIDYQPEPDFSLAPRKDIHLPLKEDNPDNAWAYQFDLHHMAPSSDLLKGKTFCVKDNVCVAGVPCLMGTDIFTDVRDIGSLPACSSSFVVHFKILDASKLASNIYFILGHITRPMNTDKSLL
jgi:hypothetical protein